MQDFTVNITITADQVRELYGTTEFWRLFHQLFDEAELTMSRAIEDAIQKERPAPEPSATVGEMI